MFGFGNKNDLSCNLESIIFPCANEQKFFIFNPENKTTSKIKLKNGNLKLTPPQAITG